MEVGITIKDQYQVVEHIGRGGMADVWSARDTRLNRLVAIKTISQKLSTDIDPVKLFETEAQTIAKMEHPHILPIYDFGDYRNSLYIVMRYVTGGSLEDKLEAQPLTLQETVQIGQNIAQALDYAHKNNVIHLDLKPPNILMDSGGSPYLADFGLATVLDKQGHARNPGSGTLLYMAPEQLVADVIDHRADIYSFAIMIYHMLTGKLPFDGMAPLAIKQLQMQQTLPNIDETIPDIPYQISDILRYGTAVDPKDRPSSLMEIVNSMREALQVSVLDMDVSFAGGFDNAYGMESSLSFDVEDAGLLEAADIYTRAKHVWAGGNGRFLLGISHFMMMCDYYIDADIHGLELDDAGRQMILRGALEYDYQIGYWWEQLDDDNRRWVCLHTIRSENAPARIRAFYRLETLPDDSRQPVIPKLVSNALSIETNMDAKLAALQVLGTRARLLKPSQSIEIKTEFRGRLLSTGTRLGIQILPPKVWQDAIYSPEIDLLIAQQALDLEMPRVAEFAARIVGQMRSLTALRFIANEQRQGTPGGLRALAFIRDEAPYLPDVVTRQGRLYAWVANTARRITDVPMSAVLRFMLALIGGAVGFGQHVYITYRSQALFTPQRWGNTLAVGLMMGLFIAILVMFADEITSRLRGFWPNWLRLLFSAIFGALLGIFTWAGFTWLYLNQPVYWELMRMGGFGLAFGLIASTLFHLKSWQAFILTSVSIFLPIFTAYYNQCTQLYICFTDSNFNYVEGVTAFSIAPVALAGFLFGILTGVFIPRPAPSVDDVPISPYGPTRLGGLLVTLVLAILSAGMYLPILQEATITWDHILLLFVVPMMISAIAMVLLDITPLETNLRLPKRSLIGRITRITIHLLQSPYRILYFVIGTVIFGFITLMVQNSVAQSAGLINPQVGADYVDALFSYDIFWVVFTVGIPVSLVIALGAFGGGLFSDLRTAIGESSEEKDRNAWLTGVLGYVLVISGMVFILAPFSFHNAPLWAVGWTALGLMTFICALATWQWKLWGARGLLICGLLFIAGGFLSDARTTFQVFSSGNIPDLFTVQSTVLWGIWGIFAGIMTIGVMGRKLWGAFGSIVMIVLWFIIALFFGNFGDSFAGLALVHVPLLVYALRFDWDKLEYGKQKAKEAVTATTTTPKLTPAPARVGDLAPSWAGNMMTEVDAVLTTEEAGELTTEYDLARAVPDYEHIAEMDSINEADTAEFATEFDARAIMQRHELKTEMESRLPDVDTSEMETQFDIDYASMEMSAIDVADSLDDSKPKLDTDSKKPDDIKSKRSKLQIDSSLLGGSSSKPASSSPEEEKPPTKSSRPRLQIDSSLLGGSKAKSGDSKPVKKDEDSTDSSRPLKLNLNTGKLKTDIRPEPKAEDKTEENPEEESDTDE